MAPFSMDDNLKATVLQAQIPFARTIHALSLSAQSIMIVSKLYLE